MKRKHVEFKAYGSSSIPPLYIIDNPSESVDLLRACYYPVAQTEVGDWLRVSHPESVALVFDSAFNQLP